MKINFMSVEALFESFLTTMMEEETDTLGLDIRLSDGSVGFQISLVSLNGVPIEQFNDDGTQTPPAGDSVAFEHPVNPEITTTDPWYGTDAPADGPWKPVSRVAPDLLEKIAQVCNEARCHSPRAVGNLDLAQRIARVIEAAGVLR